MRYQSAADFFRVDSPHGLVKRFMWMRHLQAFVATTQNAGYRTLIFDGFAGTGRYGDSWPHQVENYGSPIISLRVAIQFFIRKNRRDRAAKKESIYEDPKDKVRLFFVENNRKNFKNLCENIEEIFSSYEIPYCHITFLTSVDISSLDESFPISCVIYKEEFKNVPPPHVSKKDRLISFIDPFGYTQIPMAHVQKFVGKRKEVFINFMSQFVNRFMKANSAGIRQIFGIPEKDVYKRLDKYETGRLESSMLLYFDLLKEEADTDYGISFEMRNKQNVPLYHLVFVTNHKKGFKQMKEAMNRGNQSESKLSLSDYYILKKGQKMNLGNGQNPKAVANTIFERFKGEKNVSIKEVENFVWFSTIYVYRKKPLKILRKDGRIKKVVDRNGLKPQRKGTFPDHTEWFLTFI